MKIILILFFLLTLSKSALSSIKEDIISNLKKTKNISFSFEQNINGKIEVGDCIIQYPRKIFCKYNQANDKILVSNGKSLVIKTKSGSYYRYSIKKTPLNYILDKEFLINEIKIQKERIIDNKFINFTILRNDNEINVFFDKNNFNLIGWQTLDIYQNLNITYVHSLKKNQILEKNIFKLPEAN
tara:strand:- start:1032 stop:1583 length:552 start_codon:yes stop_codon:yes gene_type:complete